MEEDDLLTPYKEVSFEVYEQHTLDSSSWTTDSSSILSRIEDDFDDEVIEETLPEEIVELAKDEIQKRKRGRPRKPRPPTPDPAELENDANDAPASGQDNRILDGTGPQPDLHLEPSPDAEDRSLLVDDLTSPLIKRTRGRPRKGEFTVNSQKQLMQSLKYIIPEGTKRKSRPSRFLDDYDSFLPATKSVDGEEIQEKRPRGRPRTRPIKVRQLLPDGTPRGRGRPRVRPLPLPAPIVAGTNAADPVNGENGGSATNPDDASSATVDINGVSDVKCEPKQEGTINSSNSNDSGATGSSSQADKVQVFNGGIHVKRSRGRPRKYPIGEKMLKIAKRVAGPGKKLGRPRKGEEKSQKIHQLPEDSNKKWQIKLSGLFKYVTGGKSPIFKANSIGTVNGLNRAKKEQKLRFQHQKKRQIGSQHNQKHRLAQHAAEKSLSNEANDGDYKKVNGNMKKSALKVTGEDRGPALDIPMLHGKLNGIPATTKTSIQGQDTGELIPNEKAPATNGRRHENISENAETDVKMAADCLIKMVDSISNVQQRKESKDSVITIEDDDYDDSAHRTDICNKVDLNNSLKTVGEPATKAANSLRPQS